MTNPADDVLDRLRSLPAGAALCFRGQEQVRPVEAGHEVVLDGPCAASTDAGVATDNFTLPGVFAIAAGGVRRVVHRGRAHDGEVVLMPGTRLRTLGQARLDRLVVTLVAEAGDGVDVADVGARAARAIRRDLAHEPHPDVPPGRFVGDLVGAPGDTWDVSALESADSPDFTTMSHEEVRAWFSAREESAAERFRDAPPPRVNPRKAADHPHLSRVGWEVRFTAGLPCRLVLDGEARDGELGGLREIEGSQQLVLIVVDPDGEWACTRADGQAWAASAAASTGSAPERDVPVLVWRTAQAARPPGRARRATLRTVLEQQAPGSDAGEHGP